MGKKSKQGKKPQQISAASLTEKMSKDERVNEVFNKPEFMVIPKKDQKVTIGKRFEKALKDKEFNMISKVDKYGRKVNKKDNAIKDYYRIEGQAEEKKKYYDEDGRFAWN